MAPTQPHRSSLPHDLYLILTFNSLAAFERSTDHLSAVTSAAKRSNSLLVLVKFNNSPVFASSVSSSQQASSSSLAGAASAGASAGSSSGSSSAQPPTKPTTLTKFKQTQTALSRIYSAATRRFLAEDRPLAKVEVVIEELRALAYCIPAAAEVERITIDDEPSSSQVEGKEETSARSELYDVAALGGTFDHLHAGHRILLTMAALLTADAGRLIVGVSDATLLKNKKHPDKLESLAFRVEAVRSFLELIRPTIAHDVVPIEDVYGPTATDDSIQALIVSDETVAGGESINKLRGERKLDTLDVWVIKLVADDGGDESSVEGGEVSATAKMGSTGIRAWLKSQEEEGSGQV